MPTTKGPRKALSNPSFGSSHGAASNSSKIGTINKKICRFDVTAVYSHPDAKVDTILVHGLNGDPQRTWTAKDGTGVFWPTDLLPKSLEAEDAFTNVLVYGYNADVTSKKHGADPSSNYIHQHAQTLVTFLTTCRKSRRTTRNPIIWVAHSLGGILVKRALEYSDSVRAADHEDYRSIYVSTYGIIFLGTPHDGSELASWGSALQGMAGHIPRKFFDSEPILIETLRKDNETLDNINVNFLNIYQRFKIHMVHENQKTDLRGTKALIVDAKSAAPRLPGVTSYGIEASHSNMCKFAGFDAPGYRTISMAIAEWIKEAPDFISIRWNVEDEGRWARAQLEVNERARPFITSPSGITSHVAVHLDESSFNLPSQQGHMQPRPPSPLPLLLQPPPLPQCTSTTTESLTQQDLLFIRPEAFRPNSYFVGRKDELESLHSMLQDRKRRSEGTSTVLIRCQTGGGKTHMARQYVFAHKRDYPGGIFWLRATSAQELEGEFWRVARTTALRDLLNDADVSELRDHSKTVHLVRQWFSGLENWLMVLDGVMFDIPGIEDFIPDAINSSLILTSTDPAATGNHHFNNPQLLQLPLLPLHDARDLLLLEMEKRKPWDQGDIRQATELVRILGKLPLMIHVTAQHLKANQEPLATFLRRYRNRPKVGKVYAYEYVLEQLHARGATAAVNVMSILVFFDQHIPVEMVAMGLSTLGREIPYKTRDATAHERLSLNNTLRVLIAFALVDREESQHVSPTSSSSSRRSFDLRSEILDTLRIHNVTQRYFIESLAEKKQHAFWLGRAVQVFSKAFDEADRRIKDNPKVGLPDDYRRFLIHGRKLAEHLVRYERRNAELRTLRGEIEQKLEKIREEVNYLSEKIQGMIVDQSSDVPQTSIFERSNSLSESDTATSSSQSHSQQDLWTHLDDDDPRFYHSPAMVAPGLYDARGSLFPYPDDNTIPATPGLYEGAAIPTTNSTREVGQPSHDVFMHQQQKSRTDSLINQEGYHKCSSEIGVSRDVAKSSFFHNSSPRDDARLSAQSEAELALTKIRRLSPPPPRGGKAILDNGESLGSGKRTRPRDLVISGAPNYATAASNLATPTDERSSAEFYRGYDDFAVTGTSHTAETMRRFKENLDSSNLNSDVQVSSCFEQTASTPAGFPPAANPRTARSSPGQVFSSFSPPDLLVEITPTGDQSTLPPSSQRWDATVYRPDLGLGLNSMESLSLAQTPPHPMPMSYSLPSSAYSTASEAVSVTMSRDSSTHSSSSRPRIATIIRGRRHSSPPASAVSGDHSVPPTARLHSIPSGVHHSRPPSMLTEPEPRPSQGSIPPATGGAGLSWSKRISGRFSRHGRGSTQSQSPSTGPLAVETGSVHSSPDPGSAGAGKEVLARSGSGGFVVGAGTLVGFGQHSVQMGPTGQIKETPRADGETARPTTSRTNSRGSG